MEGLALGFMADRFDIVPLRAQTRRTIVFATRLHSRAIESFDLLAILGRERQVKSAGFSSVWNSIDTRSLTF